GVLLAVERLDCLADLLLLAAAARQGRPRLGRDAERHRAEQVGVAPVVLLGPPVEGMLVALSAFQADAQERHGGLLAPDFGRRALLPAPEQVERLAVRIGRLEALLG